MTPPTPAKLGRFGSVVAASVAQSSDVDGCSLGSTDSAPVVQLVELSTFNRDVAGSSPAGGTKGGTSYNEYMADYMGRRYRERRANAIAKLGGQCVECGTTENLQIDHIDPATKSFDLGHLWSVSIERYENELTKCQLLCEPHHIEKSRRERSVEHGGGLTGKRNCRCELCAPLKRAYQRNNTARWKRSRRG